VGVYRRGRVARRYRLSVAPFHGPDGAKDCAAAAFHHHVSKDMQINRMEMIPKIGQNDWLIDDVLREVAEAPLFNLSLCRFFNV
jgi:hypothetical protein